MALKNLTAYRQIDHADVELVFQLHRTIDCEKDQAVVGAPVCVQHSQIDQVRIRGDPAQQVFRMRHVGRFAVAGDDSRNVGSVSIVVQVVVGNETLMIDHPRRRTRGVHKVGVWRNPAVDYGDADAGTIQPVLRRGRGVHSGAAVVQGCSKRMIEGNMGNVEIRKKQGEQVPEWQSGSHSQQIRVLSVDGTAQQFDLGQIQQRWRAVVLQDDVSRSKRIGEQRL